MIIFRFLRRLWSESDTCCDTVEPHAAATRVPPGETQRQVSVRFHLTLFVFGIKKKTFSKRSVKQKHNFITLCCIWEKCSSEKVDSTKF